MKPICWRRRKRAQFGRGRGCRAEGGRLSPLRKVSRTLPEAIEATAQLQEKPSFLHHPAPSQCEGKPGARIHAAVPRRVPPCLPPQIEHHVLLTTVNTVKRRPTSADRNWLITHPWTKFVRDPSLSGDFSGCNLAGWLKEPCGGQSHTSLHLSRHVRTTHIVEHTKGSYFISCGSIGTPFFFNNGG